MEKLFARLEAGEESETVGLLEQWLREGKLSQEQAISESIGMFIAGVDTVRKGNLCIKDTPLSSPL